MIRHILSDGREVDSVEGFVIPPTGATAAVYRMVAEFMKKRPEITHQTKEETTNATA